MSIRVMSRVWASSKAKGTDLLVLLAIADAANDDCEAWPSVGKLAEKARTSPRNLQYHLRSLVTIGELGIVENAGKGRSNLYRVQFHSGCNELQGEDPCTMQKNSPEGCNPLHPEGEAHCTEGVKCASPNPLRTVSEPSVNRRSTPRFSPPSAEEVESEFARKGFGGRNLGTKFVARYQAVGWKYGRGLPMTDWKAAIVTWCEREKAADSSEKLQTPMQASESGYITAPEFAEFARNQGAIA